MAAAVDIIHIDEGRARAICEKIRDNMTTARDLLVEMYEGRGWEALGYDSWRECVASEFGRHQSTLYRQLEAAQVERELAADPVFAHVRKTDGDPIPDRQLVALAKAPEGTRAEVMAVAVEAAEGRPTERHVRAAVEAKKAAPEAPAEDLVKTVVNGVAKADPAIERARAEGRIPAGVAVHVEDPGDDETDLGDVREAHEERAAKADEIPDDEWLERLPLYAKLQGPSRSRFKLDALYYRRFSEKLRGSLKAFHGRTRGEVYRGVQFLGFTAGRVEMLLKVEHPERWHVCPPTDKKGCGGLGVVPMVGDCPLCRGKGYLAR